jgi:hypothetical protein
MARIVNVRYMWIALETEVVKRTFLTLALVILPVDGLQRVSGIQGSGKYLHNYKHHKRHKEISRGHPEDLLLS